MRIYFAHAKNFDYENEYYKPIEENERIKNETFIFPHKNNTNDKFNREFYSNLDLFIAEVSYRATGLGIELGMQAMTTFRFTVFTKRVQNRIHL